MSDKFNGEPVTLTSPAGNFFAITPSDGVALTQPTRAIYVGATGDIVVIGTGGDEVAVTFKNVQVGWHPIRAKFVKATGTTATLMVGAY